MLNIVLNFAKKFALRHQKHVAGRLCLDLNIKNSIDAVYDGVHNLVFMHDSYEMTSQSHLLFANITHSSVT